MSFKEGNSTFGQNVKHATILLPLLILSVSASLVHGADDDPSGLILDVSTHNFQFYSNQESINDLLVLSDYPILWVATQKGLKGHDICTGDLVGEYTDQDGLPSNDVTCLIPDGDGGMWIGTAPNIMNIWGGGLAHLTSDGTLEVFTKYNSPLPSNEIVALFSDDMGGIWVKCIGMDISHLKSNGTWDLFQVVDNDFLFNRDSYQSLASGWLSSILVDGDGGLWMGTYNNGLVHLQSDGTQRVFNPENSELPSECIVSLAFHEEGGIWIGTSNGLMRLNGDGTWDAFTSPLASTESGTIDDVYISHLLSDGNGGVWAGCSFCSFGLLHLNFEENWEILSTADSQLPGNDIKAIHSDGLGGFWVLTNRGAAHLRANGGLKGFHENDYDFSYGLSYLVSDDQGGIWAEEGVEDKIIHFSYDGECTVFDSEEDFSLPYFGITSAVSDGKGGIWVGSYADLLHLNLEGTHETLISRQSKTLSNPLHLLSDGNGGLWMGEGYRGMPGRGLFHFKSDDTWQFINSSNSELPNDTVTALMRDSREDLWIGTEEGLVQMHLDGSMELFDENNSHLPTGHVGALMSDGQGGMWIGTDNGLAHRMWDETWEVFTSENSDLPPRIVSALTSDTDGNIWCGTAGDLYQDNYYELIHMEENGLWTIFENDNAILPGNSTIYSLLPDGHGGIWVGTCCHFYGMLGDCGGLVHAKSDGTWVRYDMGITELPDRCITALYPDGNGGIWIGTNGDIGGLAHLKSDETWDVLRWNALGFYTHFMPDAFPINSLLPDGFGGIWLGVSGIGLGHMILLGTPEQIQQSDSPEIALTWFLNGASLVYQNVKFFELQRSLSKNGIYETVYGESGKPVRFHVSYNHCPLPRQDACLPIVEGHTPAVQGDGEEQIQGYTLDISAIDPEWLEGIPRYYRLSAVIEQDGKLFRVTNDTESALMAPSVEENPRVELSLERSAVAMEPGTIQEIGLFHSSLDLFTGDVQSELTTEFASTGSTDELQAILDVTSAFLNPGETVSTLLRLHIPAESQSAGEETVTLISKSASGHQEARSSLKIFSGTEPMIALSIVRAGTRPRVLEGITVTGNLIPVRAGQEVSVMGSDRDGNTVELARLITSDDGFFEGVITATAAGSLRLFAQSRGIISNSEEIFILPAITHIALTSNANQETGRNDILKIEGIITPVRSGQTTQALEQTDKTEVNLDIRYIDLADPGGGAKPQFSGSVPVDGDGRFIREIVVPGDGFIDVKATLPETPDFLASQTTLVIPIGQPVGEGIILVSESGTPEFRTISKRLGAYVYNTLRNRNIPVKRIRYLGFSDGEEDENGNENENSSDVPTLIPVDGYADKNNLQHALTDWAVSLISADDPYKTPLNLYLIGEIEDGHFRLNENETLSPAELDQFLDEAEALIKQQVANESGSNDEEKNSIKGFPVTIVLDGSQSEAWIETISGNGRIILTSSSAAPVDQGGFAGYDNLGESSFTRYFYQFINYGSDIEGSFAEANYEILKFYRHTQRPVMDADGDGVGTTKYDRYEASGKFIEYRPSGNLRPKIRTTHPDMTITGRENNTLWAIATDPEQEMKGVFCSITDPSDRTRHLELSPLDERGNWYEVKLDNFSQTGCHQVVYYAKDSAGNVSLPVERFLHVTASALHSNSDPEHPVDEPDDPVAVPQAPTLTLTMEGSRVSISWTAVPDADGYTLLYAPYPDAVTIGQFDMGSQTRISTFEAGGMAYYVAVQAYNHQGTSGLSNIESFGLIYR